MTRKSCRVPPIWFETVRRCSKRPKRARPCEKFGKPTILSHRYIDCNFETFRPQLGQETDLKVGYARTSSFEQQAGLDAQLRDLAAAGTDKIFSEQVSAVGKRLQLETAIEFIREGDTLVVTKLDRLARSTQHLLDIAERIKAKGAELHILNLGVDTSTATGKLMFTVIGAIACFERELMLERQREGIAKAKADGKYRGRKPTARAKADEIRMLKAAGTRPTDIARKLGIGRASVYRVLGTEIRESRSAAPG
jgi:DNA invertase Pin-like site-specific DNA recombinase